MANKQVKDLPVAGSLTATDIFWGQSAGGTTQQYSGALFESFLAGSELFDAKVGPGETFTTVKDALDAGNKRIRLTGLASEAVGVINVTTDTLIFVPPGISWAITNAQISITGAFDLFITGGGSLNMFTPAGVSTFSSTVAGARLLINKIDIFQSSTSAAAKFSSGTNMTVYMENTRFFGSNSINGGIASDNSYFSNIEFIGFGASSSDYLVTNDSLLNNIKISGTWDTGGVNQAVICSDSLNSNIFVNSTCFLRLSGSVSGIKAPNTTDVTLEIQSQSTVTGVSLEGLSVISLEANNSYLASFFCRTLNIGGGLNRASCGRVTQQVTISDNQNCLESTACTDLVISAGALNNTVSNCHVSNNITVTATASDTLLATSHYDGVLTDNGTNTQQVGMVPF